MSPPPTPHEPVVETKRPLPGASRQWRCRECRTLLGIARDRHIEIRYKSLRIVVRGLITVTCRRCQRESDFATGSFRTPA